MIVGAEPAPLSVDRPADAYAQAVRLETASIAPPPFSLDGPCPFRLAIESASTESMTLVQQRFDGRVADDRRVVVRGDAAADVAADPPVIDPDCARAWDPDPREVVEIDLRTGATTIHPTAFDHATFDSLSILESGELVAVLVSGSGIAFVDPFTNPRLCSMAGRSARPSAGSPSRRTGGTRRPCSHGSAIRTTSPDRSITPCSMRPDTPARKSSEGRLRSMVDGAIRATLMTRRLDDLSVARPLEFSEDPYGYVHVDHGSRAPWSTTTRH